MQNNRLLAAIVLSILILLVFQKIQKPINPPVKSQSSTNYKENLEKENTVIDDDIQTTAQSKNKRINRAENTISISAKTDKTELIINSLGAGIEQLKIRDGEVNYIELVRSQQESYPLALDEDSTWDIKKINEKGIRAHKRSNDIEFERIFTIEDNSKIKITDKFINKSKSDKNFKYNLAWKGGLGTAEELVKENHRDHRVFAKIDSKVRSKIKAGKFEGDLEWSGLVNRYFIIAIINTNKVFTALNVNSGSKKGPGCAVQSKTDDSDYPSIDLNGRVDIPAGGTFINEINLYHGSKDLNALKSLNIGLEEILSFGIFGFISKLFLNTLIVFNSVIGNYGVAIILLTVLLQIFMFPLTAKSFKSMSAMKDVQPGINKIREKFKEEPQRMNKEIMHLYKKNKVNPFGGCFPLFLQMPIFISLFTMLRAATELRNAPFLWIKDLSSADVLFSTIPMLQNIPFIGGAGPLPFLMGAAMLLQQKMTGGAMEGPQKSLTYMMPIMFTFMFIKFPSGLVLYWLSNSILTFGVQMLIKNKKK
ncbi:membrane protein insertase YidC [Elusimicrobiota bacterium]